MDFKSYTKALLRESNNEILEESIRNNSASGRLESIINKAESKLENATGKDAADLEKTISTLKKGYSDFLKLEKAYKTADSTERKELKNNYKELQNKYSYQLKRIHMPKGAAAAIIAAALAVTGAGYGVNKYNDSQKVEVYKGHDQKAEQKAAYDAWREAAKKDYIYKTQAQKNRVEKMESDNKAFRAESDNVMKIMDKAVMDLMVSPSTNTYNSVKMNNNGHTSHFNKEAFEKFAKTLFNTYDVKANPGDDIMPAVKYYLDEFNSGKPHNLYNKKITKDILQRNIISKGQQQENAEKKARTERIKARAEELRANSAKTFNY